MARKTKEDALKTREKILASALALFSKQGYAQTTFTDIAAGLKMTKGAVYWHFPTKEALLSELVRTAQAQFSAELNRLMPDGELTFPKVAAMLVRSAEKVVSTPRARQFFRLVRSGVNWSGSALAKVRSELMNEGACSPKQALVLAIESDKAAGRARADFRVDEAASVAMAIWDGLILAELDGFLTCALQTAIFHAYASIWDSMRLTGTEAMNFNEIEVK